MVRGFNQRWGWLTMWVSILVEAQSMIGWENALEMLANNWEGGLRMKVRFPRERDRGSWRQTALTGPTALVLTLASAVPALALSKPTLTSNTSSQHSHCYSRSGFDSGRRMLICSVGNDHDDQHVDASYDEKWEKEMAAVGRCFGRDGCGGNFQGNGQRGRGGKTRESVYWTSRSNKEDVI